MANEKDVFEVLEPYSARSNGTETEIWYALPEAPGGAVKWGFEVYKDMTNDLNEAFRLGYRAALMEKA